MSPFQLICLFFEENYRGWRQIIRRDDDMLEAAESAVKHAKQMRKYCDEIGGRFNERCIACKISGYASGKDFLDAYKDIRKNEALKEIE